MIINNRDAEAPSDHEDATNEDHYRAIERRLREAQEWSERCGMGHRFEEGMYPQHHIVEDIPWLLNAVLELDGDRLMCETLGAATASALKTAIARAEKAERQAEGLCDGCGKPLDDAYCTKCKNANICMHGESR